MIAREALANSASHGNPDAITIELFRNGEEWILEYQITGRDFRAPLPRLRIGITA